MLKRIKHFFTPPQKDTSPPSRMLRVTRDEHGIDRSLLSPNALKVIHVLQKAGFESYLVGGGVRDILLGGEPKDFDVATAATPEEVKKLFRSALIIGRRFKIVHVRFGREIIEVTTFRGSHQSSDKRHESHQSNSGMLLRDNVYGDVESDALRRDFTINALYYDPSTQDILDFTHGLRDVQNRVLRIIGDAESRYREDPVRMLRAVRFSGKLGFKLEAETEAPITSLASLLANIPSARLFDEVLKLFLNGSGTATLSLLQSYDLFQYLFPGTAHALQDCSEQEQQLITQAIINTDKRLRQNKRVTPAFIFAVFLWLPLLRTMQSLIDQQKMTPYEAQMQAAPGVISQQLAATAIPKRFLIPMREIWTLQFRLPRRDGNKAFSLMEHKRFRAAYDFVLLREEAGENLSGLGHWWTRFQSASEEERADMVKEFKPGERRRRRKKSSQKPRHTPQP